MKPGSQCQLWCEVPIPAVYPEDEDQYLDYTLLRRSFLLEKPGI
ncbi:MAG: hypothetical protein XD91_0101 [Clostridiales bacterium 38_11]|nr:MAG: hypothetical protein XD91_0101 [Clostridiales bacterium 38_11]